MNLGRYRFGFVPPSSIVVCYGIINYPDILDKWPVRLGTCLTHTKVISLEVGGFVLEDGPALKVPPVPSIGDAFSNKDPTIVDVTPCELPKET